MFDAAHDARVRSAAFGWLAQQVALHGDVLPRSVLAQGFMLDGIRIPLMGPQGIFKPRILPEVPISITSTPEGPYDDTFRSENLLRYRYRGTDPQHPDNRGLRAVMARRLPLVYFHGLVPGRYLATWPVYIVGDDPGELAFTVDLDEIASKDAFESAGEQAIREESSAVRRAYAAAVFRVRLHQRAFRERVLEAYRHQCAFCRLRHQELLDAAHIVPDTQPEGEPIVPNGLALCSLHHTAFDRAFLGLRPDYTIEVRPDLLREKDGPTLVHAIQALHNSRIMLPHVASLRPDPARVAARYQGFLRTFGDEHLRI
jgi:putative restriction endonuclease